MSRRQYLVDIVNHIVKNTATAEMVIDRLMEEGVLHVGYGNAEVDTILDKFSTVFGTTKATRYDRFSASRLAGKHGVQSIVTIISLLGQSEDKYKPVVNSVAQLEEKLPSILNYLRNVKGREEIDV